MTGLAKRPLCDKCREHDGWKVDPDTLMPVERCECRHLSAAPERERDAALAGTAESNPQAMKAALRIIRDTALSMPVFSSNDTRHAMKIAQVPGEIVGAAFRQAAKDRVIRGDSYIPSTDPGTHAHPVRSWRSLIFRSGAA